MKVFEHKEKPVVTKGCFTNFKSFSKNPIRPEDSVMFKTHRESNSNKAKCRDINKFDFYNKRQDKLFSFEKSESQRNSDSIKEEQESISLGDCLSFKTKKSKSSLESSNSSFSKYLN